AVRVNRAGAGGRGSRGRLQGPGCCRGAGRRRPRRGRRTGSGVPPTGDLMTIDLETLPASAPTATLPVRLRRLRRTPALRALVRETRLHPSMLVAPLFVQPGIARRDP